MPRPDISDAFWATEDDLLVEIIYPDIQQAINDGVIVGGTLVEFGVNFAAINETAEALARSYTFELVSQLNGTTRKVLQAYIGDWIVSGQPLNTLVQALSTPGDPTIDAMFGSVRARKIAITESTRLFALGNMLTWHRAEHVEGTQWNTVSDEEVDSICEQNAAAGVVPLGEDYPSGHQYPPAHVGCRCYLNPVVRKQ